MAIITEVPAGQREAVGFPQGAPDWPVLHVEFTTPATGGGGTATTTCQPFYREIDTATGDATGNDYFIDPADETWKDYTVQGEVTLGDCTCDDPTTDPTPDFELLCMTDSADTRFVRVVRIASDGAVTIIGNYLPDFPAGQYTPVGAVTLCDEKNNDVEQPFGLGVTGVAPTNPPANAMAVTLTVFAGAVTVTTPTGSFVAPAGSSFTWGDGNDQVGNYQAITFTGTTAGASYAVHGETRS